jgi:hypothetical protein
MRATDREFVSEEIFPLQGDTADELAWFLDRVRPC